MQKIILIFVVVICSSSVWAQELDPRAYQPAPTGVNAITVGYTHNSGDILFEPSLPAEDAQASLHLEAAAYYHSFGLFGRFANVSVVVPYAAGHLNGVVDGTRREIYRSGLSDFRTRFAMSLKGTPALTLHEFIQHRSKTNLGFSFIVSAPAGQYDPEKVINVGQNRWAFKPEFAFTRFYKRWQLDAYGGVWFFTENDNFRGGTQRQNPIGSFQFHMSYNLRPLYWIGFDANFYTGGRTFINDVPGTIKQSNSRFGGTFAMPLAKGHLLKLAASKGVITTRGGNFTSFGASYTYSWGADK